MGSKEPYNYRHEAFKPVRLLKNPRLSEVSQFSFLNTVFQLFHRAVGFRFFFRISY
nr:MAG TPA: hypothetical protein [Bacteriophage sp.]